MEVIATQTNWSKFCLVQGLRKLKQIGPLRRQNRSRAQENGKCSCADEWCYACPIKSADSDADTMMDELSHMSDLVKLPFLSHQASCIWHFTTKHRRRCTNGVHIQKYILKGISIFYLDQKCSLSKPYLKSGSKTEFWGKQIVSECKVEVGQQTCRRSSSNLKMQNPALKMQNGVELRNWFYLHLLRRLTLSGKHTLKEDSSILNSCSHRNIFEANKEPLKTRTTWEWRGVSASYKWKAWGLWDLPCPIIHIHDKP